MNNYIHIPFCTQKCSYCKFALTPIFDEYKKKKYLHFLEKEIIFKLKKYNTKNIETIYFGGGTPSILKIEEIKKILDLFPINQNTEITLESNPEDLNEEYLKKIFELGINRLSIGIQTLNSESLKIIGRKNNKSIFSTLESIKNIEVGKVGIFGNKKISINIDFIIGLPKVKYGEILENIKFLHKNYNFITHTSVYFLEKGLYPKDWEKNKISEEESIKEFSEICKYFKENNWNHYEISNFSKKGYECKHNIGYWTHKNCLGFGLSASEFIFDKQEKNFLRKTNAIGFKNYYKGKLEFKEELNNEQIELEKFLFGIRTNGYKINKSYNFLNKEKINKYIKKGILLGNEENFKISENSIHIIDFIIDDLIF